MPHFDEYGGDEWICQAPNHKGGRIQNSRVKSEWRPDITGLPGAGNCCPPCVRAYQQPDQHCMPQPDGECTSTDLRCMHQPEPHDPLDFNEQALRQLGVSNDPRPSVCPRCVRKS